jgi:ribosomal protein S18 acetylase RimI-like enzyme
MSEPCPEVRPASAEDVSVIADFNIAMARETESLELDPAVVRPGVAAVLQESSRGWYFVAVLDRRVVGCLLITREWSDWRNGDLWWIQSVYVTPHARGRGVFRALYQRVHHEAQAADARGLRLYVERDNTTAQATYKKLGMRLTHYDLMETIF